MRDDHRHAAVDAGARGDPQRLGGDELLGVDRRGEDRVVRALELVLHERPEHRREGAREEHRRRHRPRADEVDVVVAADLAHERAEPEAEGEQVDRRLDGRREGRRAPVRREVDDLAHEHARERRALEAAEALACGAWRPVSVDLLPGQEDEHVLEVRRAPLALGRVAVGAVEPSTATLVPVRRVRQPGRGGLRLDLGEPGRRPVDLDRLAAGVLGDQIAGAPAATALPCDMIITVSARRSASSM